MSKCMTIADESIDQKDTCREITPKEIVEFVLEEILLSALLISDKGCSRIGDFNITEDFCQQYDRPQYLRDFEQVNHTGNPSVTNQELNVVSGKSTDRPASLVTAKENLELIIGSFVKKEDKCKAGVECTVIGEEVLADNELQIQNGQSHIEKNNNRGKTFPEAAAREYFDRKDVITDEKIEIQYYNEGKLSKIYVPLIPSNRLRVESPLGLVQVEEKAEEPEEDSAEVASGQMNCEEDIERPFKPFTTEEFRQVWENINSSLVGKWDGDVSAKREEVGALMEKLSSVQVFSDASVDPNRPRACAFGEEDVKKIIKEIEEISFTQSPTNSEDFDVAYHPDGQGDANLESRSFFKGKDNLDKAWEVEKPQEALSDVSSCENKSSEDARGERTQVFSSEELLLNTNEQLSSEKSVSERSLQVSSEKIPAPEEEQWTHSGTAISVAMLSSDILPKKSTANIRSEDQALEEESLYSNGSLKGEMGTGTALLPMFNVDLPPERMHQMTESPLGAIYSHCKEDIQNSAGSLLTAPELWNEYCAKDPPLWEPEAVDEQDQSIANVKVTSEIDSMEASGSLEDLQDRFAELNRPSRQKVNGSSLNPANTESNGLEMNSFSRPEVESPGTDNYPEQPCSDRGRSPETSRNGTSRKEFDSAGITKIENAGLAHFCIDGEDLEKLKQKIHDVRGSRRDGNQALEEGAGLIFNKSPAGEQWSQKSLNYPEEPNENDTNLQFSVSSLTPSQAEYSNHSLSEGEVADISETSHSMFQTFKLHSQKMYLGVNHEADSQPQQECTLTESEEAFIDETESVLQIIEPQELSEDENSGKVSFSLLSELSQGESSSVAERESSSELLLRKNYSREFETSAKKAYSGMTTIGPLKNSDYDPKDLTLPNIDFGKMTRITSSRQLTKEIDMFGTELNSAASVKIVEEDSDNDLSLNLDDDHVEFTSLVNRDIASLTKVQKVREVMSHHPKPEDDFEDEDVLPRPRLDLKDVESMSDERYKVPDVGIPLLSLELGNSNIATENELIENMGLVLSGIANPVYYDEQDFQDNSNMKAQRKQSTLDNDSAPAVELPDGHDLDKQTSTSVENTKEISSKNAQNESHGEENQSGNEEILGAVDNNLSQYCNFSNSPKHSTLGGVFRKASSKFIRRDGDLFLRNSKSLPRETTKIAASDSIRSILDDCQSSASNFLKKSKSLLKNTQSIFKSMSSSRVSSERDSGQDVEKKKLSPSDSDVSTLERKLSCFLKKEEFTKAKNVIKSKVEKTLKHLDSGNSTASDKVSLENKDFQVVLRDEEKLRVDKMENFRKMLPKSPLVYKSQFVKSQISVLNNSAEAAEVALDCNAPNPEQVPLVAARDDITYAGKTESQKQSHSEIKIPLQESQQWSTDTKTSRSSVSEQPEPQQPDYIVMETIQGLPTADLESPSSEKENVSATARDQVQTYTDRQDIQKILPSNSLQQACADGVNDVAPCFPELDEEKIPTKTVSERKAKTKKKKLSARFRSFWSSAFRRIKTPPNKADLS